MLRFRNPGSNIETQLHLFQNIYKGLKNREYFDLADMERVSLSTAMVTAYGYSGDQALAITSTRSESLNSTRMNLKMYAEVFRMLGWIAPASRGRSYPLRFTLIGCCVGESSFDGAFSLAKQSALGFVSPSEISHKVKYTESVRFFPLVLRTLRDLGGIMYKHELCMGPMSCDDDDGGKSYAQMIERISRLRGDYQQLQSAFQRHCDSLGMAKSSVDNSTRFPIGLLRGLGWIETGVKDKTLYGKTLTCFRLTQEGEAVLEECLAMEDLRLSGYRSLDVELRSSMVRIGIYSMLERAGFDVESVRETLVDDTAAAESVLGGRDLLFSPYQTIWPDEVDVAIGFDRLKEPVNSACDISVPLESRAAPPALGNRSTIDSSAFTYNMSDHHADSRNRRVEELRQVIEVAILQEGSTEQAIEFIAEQHRIDKHTEFYPFVADLFTLIGMPCHVSRAGDNGARWDAIIIDDSESIPIEIKSPTEELHLSLKALRQALENKIVLLSRNTHRTSEGTASLVVGYELPNARAEVSELVQNIFQTYGYRIGVLGVRTLLQLAIEAVRTGKIVDPSIIRRLKGVVDVAI